VDKSSTAVRAKVARWEKWKFLRMPVDGRRKMSSRKYNYKRERLTFLLNLELATMKYSNILKGGMWSRLKRVKGIGEKNLAVTGDSREK